ncbi:PepSY-associated TM helix domain-containing protein [Methylocystis bryophila]|uniref:Peptidase n=1 Tax=Methylocystis bryophila TaxID=655015 RepID=A0A1W6MQA8_9HYPH|nr:PepSY-associated TM helix domain-containing protein [Methylocystis bryophila]ARN79767.1 peptidase [Methylocystis bryophila]BDV39642.1 hypothetical protein DSM21852_28950 [Methylocystis bryophila]
MARAFWVWLHRWTGLAMAGFLILVGLTGSLLAFWPEVNHWFTPELYPGPHAGIELSAATLARRAEEIVPQGRVSAVIFADPGSVMIGMEPREGAPPLDFEFIHLDPISSKELGRVTWHALPRTKNDIMPFIYGLHMYLAMKGIGDWILGFVALLWTLDCFVAFYLTLPLPGANSGKGFLARWKPAWLIKWGASFYRINFDMHRAGGLWLWTMLLVFAWSSVSFTMPKVYTNTMRAIFDYETPDALVRSHAGPSKENPNLLEWEGAQAAGERLMADEARIHDFAIERPIALYLSRALGLIEYRVRSSRDIGDRSGATSVIFDAYSGALRAVNLPTGQRAGNTVTTWLRELHVANVFGLPYRIFVSALGLAIVMLSVTGVYIWWKKRQARKNRSQSEASKFSPKPKPDERELALDLDPDRNFES